MKARVGIVMGSESDLPVMQKAAETLKEFEVPFHVAVASAHRAPKFLHRLIEKWSAEGVNVFIAGAGAAAHLAGVVASQTPRPVIWVPIGSSKLSGMDALLSTVQMPPGVPVAAVAVDGAKNAALLAVQILAVADAALARRFAEYKEKLAEAVESKHGEKFPVA